jgi:hypothetical protein
MREKLEAVGTRKIVKDDVPDVDWYERAVG